MGKKGKGYRREEEQQPVKKKNIITEQQLMDKSHMDRTEFIPLLIQDTMYEPFIYKEENQIAVKKVVTDLNHLLYIDFKNFWATVLYNPSLKNCLSSCLSFLHRRWLNCYRFSKETQEEFEANEENQFNYKRVKDEPIFQYTQGLAQVILVIYHRIVSFNLENKELSGLYKINEEISRKYILDFPKLFELAEIYGETNPDTVYYIVKMFSKTIPTFYQTLTTNILPFIFKRMEEVIKRTKVVTERQEYGVNYSYKRLNGRQLSQGQEQFIKKTTILMEMVSFINIIKNIFEFFPEDCQDHCFFNSQIQYIFENMFLELQAAYKIWDFQTQEIKLLNIVNYILKECLQYFFQFFDRCNDIIVLRNRRSSTVEAYINSLGRMFKEYGKRAMTSKKNQVRNMLMYKILQKRIDLLKMAQTIYQQEIEESGENFNLQYLKDFIINMETATKEEYINDEEPRQEEIEEETQAPQGDKDDDFDEKEDPKEREAEKQESKDTVKVPEENPKEPELEQLEIMVPKRLRSEDYYTKLYANFQNKFYKGQYEDDYDDALDYDKRPLFFQEESSNSESQSENQRHLVSNSSNLQHVKSLHSNSRINRESTRVENANKPKYERVNNYPNNPPSNNRQPVDKPKVKYVAKQSEEQEQQNTQIEEKPAQQINQENPNQPQEERRGGQGYKKNNKSYNNKPKDKHQPKDKHSNTNKNRQAGNGNKRYRQK